MRPEVLPPNSSGFCRPWSFRLPPARHDMESGLPLVRVHEPRLLRGFFHPDGGAGRNSVNLVSVQPNSRDTHPEHDAQEQQAREVVDVHTAEPGPTFAGRRVSIVIPALNEAENLPLVLQRIPEWTFEVLLVDGHSSDATVEVARKAFPRIRVLYEQRSGKGAALRTGFAAARGDIIVTLDADGSADPREIPAFMGVLLAGADFAKGSRFIHGGGTSDMPLYRRLGNQLFVRIVRALYGGHYSDLCYGYNAFWTRVLPALCLDGDGFEIETMMNLRALKASLQVVEVASFEAKRVYGEGRLRAFPDGWRVLKTILRERFSTTTVQLPTSGELRISP